GSLSGEALALASPTANENTQPQHEQDVPDDAAGERGLHHLNMAGAQGEDRDDQLGGISHGGVEQPAKALSQVRREIFRGLAEHSGQRNDSERSNGKDDQRGRLPDKSKKSPNRNKEQQ